MATFKKIILFLFGIVLVVFGNRTAINTIFPDNAEDKKSVSDSNNSETETPSLKQNQGDNIESSGTKIESDQAEEATATQ